MSNDQVHEFTLERLAGRWEKSEISENELLLHMLMWMQSLVSNQELTERSLARLKREVGEFREGEEM